MNITVPVLRVLLLMMWCWWCCWWWHQHQWLLVAVADAGVANARVAEVWWPSLNTTNTGVWRGQLGGNNHIATAVYR